MRIIIFTAIFGRHQLSGRGASRAWGIPHVCKPPDGWDLTYHLFTDKQTYDRTPALRAATLLKGGLWDVHLCQETARNPRLMARRIKIVDYLHLLPPHDVSIWVDANVSMVEKTCFERFQGVLPLAAPLWTLPHPARGCTYDEIEYCFQNGMTHDLKSFRLQRQVLKNEGFPRGIGLAETRILGRRPTKEVTLFNEAWWSWFTLIPSHHLRDQCAFMPALWTCGILDRMVWLLPDDRREIFLIQREHKHRSEIPTFIRKRFRRTLNKTGLG